MRFRLVIILMLAVAAVIPTPGQGHTVKQYASSGTDTICLADPTVFADRGKYYLYGTGGRDGFLVYQSDDLVNWTGPVGKNKGYALTKGDTYGETGFWAPQIFKEGSIYYMAYTANEHIAIAQSDSPLGPFVQQQKKALSDVGKQIDPFIFKDTDGQLYLYHVRLGGGNRIFVARMKDDLSDDLPETARECIVGTASWENTQKTNWPVTEGPTVLKKNNLYYLFYSANDFRNPDYAIGYAVSASPLGPWRKFDGNPIISKNNTGYNGTGHGDFFIDKAGHLQYVLHTHYTNQQVSPRKTALIRASFVKAGKGGYTVVVDPASFKFVTIVP